MRHLLFVRLPRFINQMNALKRPNVRGKHLQYYQRYGSIAAQ